MEQKLKTLIDTVVLAFPRTKKSEVFFNRRELEAILRIYGRKVIAGEWRDYAIDQLDDKAMFSIFRRSSEMPLYRVVKTPENAKKQGIYSVLGVGGTILKRGHQLASVLAWLEK
jgi:hypothetical protein